MRARKASFRFSGIPEFGNRNSEAGGSPDIGPPWRDDFVALSGLRKPGLGQGENLRPNLIV